MQVIEELLYQKTAQGLDWFFSVWWYWLPAGIGFLFRFGLLNLEENGFIRKKQRWRDNGGRSSLLFEIIR